MTIIRYGPKVCHWVFFLCVAFYEVLIEPEFFEDSRRYQHKRQLLVVNDGSEGLRIPRAVVRPRGCLT